MTGWPGVREISGKFKILEMSGNFFASKCQGIHFIWLLKYKISKTTRKCCENSKTTQTKTMLTNIILFPNEEKQGAKFIYVSGNFREISGIRFLPITWPPCMSDPDSLPQS